MANLTAGYGRIEVLHGVSLSVSRGEIVAIVGANGAGKTTLLNTIAGVHTATSGSIEVAGEPIARLVADKRVARGVSLVPEGRQVFGPLSVNDNLRLGAYHRGGPSAADFDAVFSLFPILHERRGQAAGSLSGGQQQMLAVARAMMARPTLLLLDEPSMGLAPMVARDIYAALAAHQRELGLTVLLVEQNVSAAFSFASRAYVLETGRVSAHGPVSELAGDPRIRQAYLAM